MNKLRRMTVLVTALTLTLGMILAGCGQGSTPTATTAPVTTTQETTAKVSASDVDLSQEVELKTWLVGDKPTDYDMVMEQVNQLLKSKMNTTIDSNFISMADVNTKYPLLLSSGEYFDLVFTADWNAFATYAAKNAYMELTTDMIQKYAPRSYEELITTPAFKQNLVKGKLYTLPISRTQIGSETLVAIRGDLREKYNLSPLTSPDDYKNFLLTIAKNEKDVTPYAVAWFNWQMLGAYYAYPTYGAFPFAWSFIGLDVNDPDQKLFLVADDPKFLEFCNLMKEFKDAGVFPSDAVSAQDTYGQGQAFTAGKSAALMWNVSLEGPVRQVLTEHPEWKPEIYDISPDGPAFPSPYRSGMAIGPNSKYWQRALMVLDEIRMDKTAYDLFNYGIPGKHWNPVGDKEKESLPDAKNYSGFFFGTYTSLTRTDSDPTSQAIQKIIDVEKTHIANNYYLNGFQFDTAGFKSQDAALTDLANQYILPLSLGAFPDPAKALKEYKEKCVTAGLMDYFAEFQKQTAAYAASMK